MLSFTTYKIFHIVSVFIFLTATSVTFFQNTPTEKNPPIGFKITSGLSGFLILFTGIGLLHKMGIGFPLWSILKGLLWIFLVAFGAIAAKRIPQRWHVTCYVIIMLAATVAVMLAVGKWM